jgi:hypothetical protein
MGLVDGVEGGQKTVGREQEENRHRKRANRFDDQKSTLSRRRQRNADRISLRVVRLQRNFGAAGIRRNPLKPVQLFFILGSKKSDL